MLTLREEILVVMRYEIKSVPTGKMIGQNVVLFRENCGDDRTLYVREYSKELKDMTSEGVLYPWVFSAEIKKLKSIEDIDAYDPRVLYYTLTYRGYREHLEAIERLATARGDFRKLLRKKPGQS